MAKLDYLSSQPVEELKQQLLNYTDEINQVVNFLGPLIDIPYINEIEDINVLENLEKGIIDLVNCIRNQKENNLKELYNAECGMNQFFQQNPFYYTMNDIPFTLLPHNPVLSQSNYHNGSKDTNECNIGYNVTMNEPAHTWASMDGIEQTVIDQPTDSIPVTETVVSMESEEIASILQNKRGINGNTENNFDMKGLPESSTNESNDFLDYLLEPDVFFPEDNVEQGVGTAVHDNNFQNWSFKPSNF